MAIEADGMAIVLLHGPVGAGKSTISHYLTRYLCNSDRTPTIFHVWNICYDGVERALQKQAPVNVPATHTEFSWKTTNNQPACATHTDFSWLPPSGAQNFDPGIWRQARDHAMNFLKALVVWFRTKANTVSCKCEQSTARVRGIRFCTIVIFNMHQECM